MTTVPPGLILPNTPPVPGLPSGPVSLTLGQQTVIPYPSNIPPGPVPLALPWVVIINSSPYILQVYQGGLIDQIAAFTQDLVQLSQVDGHSPIEVVPLSGGANIAPGTDATAAATWYSQKPAGSFPAAIGAGAIPLAQASVLLNAIGVLHLPLPNVYGLPVQPWMQALAIRFQDLNSNATQVTMQVAGAAFNDQYFFGAVPNESWLFVPVGGNPVNLTIRSTNGGDFTGNLQVYGLIGPIEAPYIASSGSTVLFPQAPPGVQPAGTVPIGPQLPVNVAVNAGQGNVPMIVTPPAGYAYKLTSWAWHSTGAPGAIARVDIHGINSGLAILRDTDPTNQTGHTYPCNIWVVQFVDFGGTAGQVMLGDGIAGNNPSTANLTMSINYEMWPLPYGPLS